MADESNVSGFHGISLDPSEDLISSTINTSSSLSVEEVPGTSVMSAIKRKSSPENSDHLTSAKRINKESTTTNSSPPSLSQEEIKMNDALVAARAQITKLECDIQHQNSVFEEIKVKSELDRELTVELHNRDEENLLDMHNRLQTVMKEHQESEVKWEVERLTLEKKLADLEAKLLEANGSSKNQVSEVNKDMAQLQQVNATEEAEGDLLGNGVAKLTIGSQDSSLKEQLEKQTLELQQLKHKLNVVEFEKDCYKAWQLYSSTAQRRLTMTSSLEEEVVRLSTTRHVLEEQIKLLTASNEALQPLQLQIHEAKVKITVLESSLEAWERAAQAHGVQSARALRVALDPARRRSTIYSSSVGTQTTNSNEINRLKTVLQAQGTDLCSIEVAELKRQLENTRKDLESKKKELKTLSKEYEEIIHNFVGYKIENLGSGDYRLSSVYSRSEDECLYLSILEGSILIKCGEALGHILKSHEHEYNSGKSVPVFLGAVTKALHYRNNQNL